MIRWILGSGSGILRANTFRDGLGIKQIGKYLSSTYVLRYGRMLINATCGRTLASNIQCYTLQVSLMQRDILEELVFKYDFANTVV